MQNAVRRKRVLYSMQGYLYRHLAHCMQVCKLQSPERGRHSTLEPFLRSTHYTWPPGRNIASPQVHLFHNQATPATTIGIHTILLGCELHVVVICTSRWIVINIGDYLAARDAKQARKGAQSFRTMSPSASSSLTSSGKGVR